MLEGMLTYALLKSGLNARFRALLGLAGRIDA